MMDGLRSSMGDRMSGGRLWAPTRRALQLQLDHRQLSRETGRCRPPRQPHCIEEDRASADGVALAPAQAAFMAPKTLLRILGHLHREAALCDPPSTVVGV